MARFKITCRCVKCGFKWSRVTSDPESDDPPCPRPVKYDDDGKVIETCGTEVVPIGMDLSLNKAPATVGGNIHVRAMDETAQIVMQDYGMTDMRDDVRPGENAAPKLPPRQQQMADNFFGGGGAARQRRVGFNPGQHAAAALRGALVDAKAPNALAATHAARTRPPIHVMNVPGSERP